MAYPDVSSFRSDVIDEKPISGLSEKEIFSYFRMIAALYEVVSEGPAYAGSLPPEGKAVYYAGLKVHYERLMDNFYARLLELAEKVIEE